MKKLIYLDAEFHEYHKQPKVLGFNVGKPIPTIDLISIGLVDDKGAEYYAICNEVNLEDAWANTWLRENVLWEIYMEMSRSFEGKSFAHSMNEYDHLKFSEVKRIFNTYGKSKAVIAKDIVEFVKAEESDVECLAYYSDYDWVVTAQLFGTMMDLPNGFPMYCTDIQQIIDENNIDKAELKRQVPQDNIHNALDDARWNKKAHAYIVESLADNSDETVPNLDDNGDTESVSQAVSNWNYVVDSHKEDIQQLRAFREAITKSQVDINPEINKMVDENFWELSTDHNKSVPAQDIADVDGNVWVDERDNKSYVPGTDQIVSFDSISNDTSSDVSYDSCND